MTTPRTLSAAAVHVLTTPDKAAKVDLTRAYADAWTAGRIADVGDSTPPERPSRPSKPELLAPNLMPKRAKGSPAGRAAFAHAIAHIEFNAIDLAWDIVARFTHENMPKAFYDDWVATALDEAEHFAMLDRRLGDLGFAYGDLSAHDGLWQAAMDTADDLMARLAVVPMVLEARGLDTTPVAAGKLRRQGDAETADMLEIIGEQEMPHVAAGVRWFEFLAHRRGVATVPTFHAIVRARFVGLLKPPFNAEARLAAGMPAAYYEPLATRHPSPADGGALT